MGAIVNDKITRTFTAGEEFDEAGYLVMPNIGEAGLDDIKGEVVMAEYPETAESIDGFPVLLGVNDMSTKDAISTSRETQDDVAMGVTALKTGLLIRAKLADDNGEVSLYDEMTLSTTKKGEWDTLDEGDTTYSEALGIALETADANAGGTILVLIV